MKTFKIYLFISFFLLSFSVLRAQDEIYNEKAKKEVVETINTTVDVKDFDNYCTERDFYAKERKKHTNKDEIIFSDDECEKKKNKRNNGVAVQIAAEIVFEVFINALFVVATCW